MASFAIDSWRARSTALDLSFDGVLEDEARTDKSEFAAECAPAAVKNPVPQGRLNLAQDAVLG
jgi:hypothetical protein